MFSLIVSYLGLSIRTGELMSEMEDVLTFSPSPMILLTVSGST